MAYLVRRLLENTANESFLRQTYAEARDLEETIRAPDVSDAELPQPEEPTERPPTDPDDPGPFQNEPVAEFRHAVVRERFAKAVARAQPFSAPVLIGGRAIDTADVIVSVDPSDPVVLTDAKG